MANATEFHSITSEVAEDYEDHDEAPIVLKEVPEGVEVFEIYGPFFFGAANTFRDTLRGIEKKPRVLILRLRHVFTIDATAMQALEEVIERTRHDGSSRSPRRKSAYRNRVPSSFSDRYAGTG